MIPANLKKYLSAFGVILMLVGIFLRIYLWWQNRNLIIDEANIIFNLQERSYLQLLKPLSYEQYAPALFLWFQKFTGSILGFDEMAMRLPPLLASIAVLIVFYFASIKILPHSYVYILYFLCASFAVIELATSVKQYNFDLLVSCVVILLTYNTLRDSAIDGKKLLPLALIGSIGIWLSMPAIFVLSGAVMMFGYAMLRTKKINNATMVISLVWIVQMCLNYFYLLKPNIHLPNLEAFHNSFFLNWNTWSQNFSNLKNFIAYPMGATSLAISFHGFLFCTGIFYLIRHHKSFAVFLLTPILLTIVAAALHKYSLIERLMLFLFPFVLLIVGFGLSYLLSLIKGNYSKYLYVLLSLVCLVNFRYYSFIYRWRTPYIFHQITAGLNVLDQQHVNGKQVIVHPFSVPTYKYYTTVQSQKAKWQNLKDAFYAPNEYKFGSELLNGQDTNYVIFAGGLNDAEKQQMAEQINANFSGGWLVKEHYVGIYWFAKK
jgi:hypothetical protein